MNRACHVHVKTSQCMTGSGDLAARLLDSIECDTPGIFIFTFPGVSREGGLGDEDAATRPAKTMALAAMSFSASSASLIATNWWIASSAASTSSAPGAGGLPSRAPLSWDEEEGG